MSEFRAFWDNFCVENYRFILAFALRLVNHNLSRAQEIAQQTVLRLLKYAPDPKNISNHHAFAFRTAKNIWHDQRSHPEESLDDLTDWDPNLNRLRATEDLAEIFENWELLQRAAGPLLTPELIITLTMWLEGHTWQEIAAVLNEPVSRTKFRWYSFLKKVRERWPEDHDH